MESNKIVPSEVSASSLHAILTSHAAAKTSPEEVMCSCGVVTDRSAHRYHVSRVLSASRVAVVHGSLLYDPITRAVELTNTLLRTESSADWRPSPKGLDVYYLTETLVRLESVYAKTDPSRRRVADTVELLSRSLDASSASDMVFLPEGDVAFKCPCGDTLNGDWNYEFHRFAHAIHSGVVFGSVNDLHAVSDTVQSVTNTLTHVSGMPFDKVDQLRLATDALRQGINEAANPLVR